MNGKEKDRTGIEREDINSKSEIEKKMNGKMIKENGRLWDNNMKNGFRIGRIEGIWLVLGKKESINDLYIILYN